jgi:hypothetical protein
MLRSARGRRRCVRTVVAPRSALPFVNHLLGSPSWRKATLPLAGRLDLRCWRERAGGQRPNRSLRDDTNFRRSQWRRCSPFSPPSSRSSPSIAATPFVPDADRMTAPGRDENWPRCASQFGGNRNLIGDPPLAPYRVAIPGTVPLRNRVASFDAVPSTSASPATTRIPSLKGRGLATPSVLPVHFGPCQIASSVN